MVWSASPSACCLSSPARRMRSERSVMTSSSWTSATRGGRRLAMRTIRIAWLRFLPSGARAAGHLWEQVFENCKAGGNDRSHRPLATIMNRFFFDLAGEFPAKDVLGHLCSSRREAKEHARFIAQRIGTERPNFAKPGNFIEVRGERGDPFFAAPIR